MFQKILILCFCTLFTAGIYAKQKKAYRIYFKEKVSDLLQIEKKLDHPALKALIEKIVCEGKSKNIPPQKILAFLQSELPRFQWIMMLLKNKKNFPAPVAAQYYELLRNRFSPKTLRSFHKDFQRKNFGTRLSKSLYFFLYLKNYPTIFNANELSQISIAVFEKNPKKEYVDQIIRLIFRLRQFASSSKQSAALIQKHILKLTPPRLILDALREIQ